jgi:hypothetical protein
MVEDKLWPNHSSHVIAEVSIVHLLWHLGLLVFSVLHGVVEMREDGIDGRFVCRIEGKEGDEVVVVDL